MIGQIGEVMSKIRLVWHSEEQSLREKGWGGEEVAAGGAGGLVGGFGLGGGWQGLQ